MIALDCYCFQNVHKTFDRMELSYTENSDLVGFGNQSFDAQYELQSV